MTLIRKFCVTGGAVLLGAVIVVGAWVANRIEQAVVANTAGAAALYMDSFISPLAQELVDSDTLSIGARTALEELISSTAIGDRVISYKLWKPGGLVVHASNPDLIGQKFPVSEELEAAFAGRIGAEFSGTDHSEEDPESAAELALGVPLLEVYSPIRAAWSGEVFAVAEFYEIADQLETDLATAYRTSWLVVAGTFLVCGAALFGIVRSGSRTIERQQSMLEERIARTEELAEQNALLTQRAISASARAAARAEQRLRQVSADLHDGPGQNLSLAALRIERVAPDTPEAQEEARTIREALNSAISEIRAISRGLAMPDLETLRLDQVATKAVQAISRQTDREIPVTISPELPTTTGQSARIAVYRFIQEGLSNAIRHAEGKGVSVTVGPGADPSEVVVCIRDKGPGFDPSRPVAPHSQGGQGLAGLRDRIESLGGTLSIDSAPGKGTKLKMTLNTGRETTDV